MDLDTFICIRGMTRKSLTQVFKIRTNANEFRCCLLQDSVQAHDKDTLVR